MKEDFTSREWELRSAKGRTQDENRSIFGNPALRTIRGHIREGHLSSLTVVLVLLLIIGTLAFGVYFVSSDSEAVQQAQAMIDARKASSAQP